MKGVIIESADIPEDWFETQSHKTMKFIQDSLPDSNLDTQCRLLKWYRNQYEYTRHHPSTEEFALYELGDYLIPLGVYHTDDMGTLRSLSGDVYFPTIYEKQCAWLSDQDTDFKMLPQIGEYIIDLEFDTFEQHLKYLSQVGRAWKKNTDAIFELDMVSGMKMRCLQSNSDYFIDKQGGTRPSTETCQRFARSILGIPECETFRVTASPDVYGYATVTYNERIKQVYWVNTVCMRNEESNRRSFGNYILLKILELAYNTYGKGATLNLGLDVFSYKTIWKPRQEYRWGAYL